MKNPPRATKHLFSLPMKKTQVSQTPLSTLYMVQILGRLQFGTSSLQPNVTATYVHEFICSCFSQKNLLPNFKWTSWVVPCFSISILSLYPILPIILFNFFLLNRYHLFMTFKYKKLYPTNLNQMIPFLSNYRS